MRPAYSPRVRIYRGQRRRVAEGACPVCEKTIAITSKGKRREHRDGDGLACPGSGIQVEEWSADFDIDAAVAAVVAMGPAEVRLEKSHSYDRATGSLSCPECGRTMPSNGDGTLRTHRPEADTFVGPYCPGGRPKGQR